MRVIGITGPTGSGKSTLLTEIARQRQDIAVVEEGARALLQVFPNTNAWKLIEGCGTEPVQSYLLGQWRVLEFAKKYVAATALVTDRCPVDNLFFYRAFKSKDRAALDQMMAGLVDYHMQHFDALYYLPPRAEAIKLDEARSRDSSAEEHDFLTKTLPQYSKNIFYARATSIEGRLAELNGLIDFP